MELCVKILADIMSIIRGVCFGKIFLFEKKNFQIARIVVIVFVSAILSIVMSSLSNEYTTACIYVLEMIVAMVFFFQGPNIQRIFWGIAIIMLTTLLDQVVMLVYYSWKAKGIYYEGIEHLAIQGVTSVICYLAYIWIFKKKKQTVKLLYIAMIAVFTLIFWAAITVISDFDVNIIYYKWNKWNKAAFSLMVVIYCVLIFWSIRSFDSIEEHAKKEVLLEKYLKEQQDYYVYLEQRESDTRRFRHDLRSHLYMLQAFAESGDQDALHAYAEKMGQQIEQFGRKISVNYGIADAILNRFASMAEDAHVQMQVKGHFPIGCQMDPYIICTILSNVLSNAIEAAMECEAGWVKAEFSYDDKAVFIVVRNNCKGKRVCENDYIASTKKDRKNHGFGMQNIKDSIEKNGGEMKIVTPKEDGQEFKIWMMLNYTKTQP